MSPTLDNGVIVYAGVDYERILRQAEQEVDIVLWDGGNNDLPFFKPDLHIVVADPHRPGHELAYHPGEANARMADVFVLNKVDTAVPEHILAVRANSTPAQSPMPSILEGASPLFVDDPSQIRGKRVLVVEDGPTLTHGEMAYGAGWVAAQAVWCGRDQSTHGRMLSAPSKRPMKNIPTTGTCAYRPWAMALMHRYASWNRRSTRPTPTSL
jgi:predicted GTPase